MYGEMGAGKTTLIKAICDQLGVTDSMSSPTFSLINEYETSNQECIYHFDFYRIKNQQEALDIGVEEYFYSDKYCFISTSFRSSASIRGLLMMSINFSRKRKILKL